MYLHKIQLRDPFPQRRLGNSPAWAVAYDGRKLKILHKSGREYCIEQSAPTFIGIDIRGGTPKVFPIKKPHDPRRALLWEHGYRRRNEVDELPPHEPFLKRFCSIPDGDGDRNERHAPLPVYRSDTLFIGYVSEENKRKVWWMHTTCTLEEVEAVFSAGEKPREAYASE